MARAPYQVLILPYRRVAGGLEYAVFLRNDASVWQGLAGGGEADETPIEAARREALEEAGIQRDVALSPLGTVSSIPACVFAGTDAWGESTYVVPDYAFGIDCTGIELTLSSEHASVEWLSYDRAYARLTFDGNRTALWELHQRLRGLGPRGEVRERSDPSP